MYLTINGTFINLFWINWKEQKKATLRCVTATCVVQGHTGGGLKRGRNIALFSSPRRGNIARHISCSTGEMNSLRPPFIPPVIFRQRNERNWEDAGIITGLFNSLGIYTFRSSFYGDNAYTLFHTRFRGYGAFEIKSSLYYAVKLFIV